MSTKIFLPLRSNIGWFSEQQAIERFERLLKVHIALFDEIILQDGTLHFLSDGKGQGLEMMMQPEASNRDRTKLKFYTPGGNFGVAMGDMPVMQGQMSFGCDADFFPILHRAGLNDATYFEWSSDELIPEIKRETDRLAESDNRDLGLTDVLPNDPYLKKELLKGFYRDAVLAQEIKTPFAIDFHLSPFLNRKRELGWKGGMPSVPLRFLDHWIKLNLPDFSEFAWSEIHELHESPSGEDFRRLVERITQQVEDAMSTSATQSDIDNLVSEAFSTELLKELRPRRATLSSATANLLLNFVPIGPLISGAKDYLTVGRDATSWISLL